MYNIDIYSYWKKPFSKQRNFSIHPLDEPGKHKMFFTDESPSSVHIMNLE